MQKNFLVTAAVVGVIVIAGIWLLTGSKKTAPVPSSQTSPAPALQEEASPSATVSQNVVRITSSGFEPQTITIKAGESVTWVNENTVSHQVNSAVHPTHQVYPSLNTIGLLQAGESKSLVFPEAGSFKYHDHLNPSLTGSVVVE
ncbi:cupredoxin domain-containing protein [Candidatus Daviesbacteria bacterium]|nr:cupredoxin domain-containing protein [Candidatus Daviesbacteria bacterium]